MSPGKILKNLTHHCEPHNTRGVCRTTSATFVKHVSQLLQAQRVKRRRSDMVIWIVPWCPLKAMRIRSVNSNTVPAGCALTAAKQDR